jgi:hypothetical protein
MNNELTPIQRLKRLQGIFDTAKIELDEIITMMEDTNIVSTDTSEITIPISPLKLVGGKEKTITPFKTLYNLFIKYLSPTAMEGGRGFIKPNASFNQYDEDIMLSDPARLLTWPNGFYRNRDTRETQLLLHVMCQSGQTVIFCIDKLPSLTNVIRIFGRNVETDLALLDLQALSEDSLTEVFMELDNALKKIIDMHF